MNDQQSSTTSALVTLGAACACLVALHLAGSGVLAAPPVTSVDELRAWVEATDPFTAGLAAARLVALGFGYHLVATTALVALGRLARRPGLVRLATRATLPPLRRTSHRMAGLVLSVTAVASGPAAWVAASPSVSVQGASFDPDLDPAVPLPAGAVVIDRIAGSEPPPPSTAVLSAEPTSSTAGDGTAVLHTEADAAEVDLPTESNAEADATSEGAGASDDEVLAESEPAGSIAAGRVHLAEPGDHLWAIAAHEIAVTLGRTPEAAEVVPYWSRVVRANPQLADPDLLFPGDPITIPPMPR